ncbi:AmmeMemoRadiSam system radical SAM enzyme [candidate division CSSED10-310 bacterium]|uniref:AmmeMemoRadiSam system radical SAM enzyme n=1 Tax=candidate division CSSED10-310 bacterium TaxID=2855610 RepID=A0ABV6YWS9_UNCC1
MKEALFYQKIDAGQVKCQLCPHQCLISPQKVGVCKVRKNIQGTLFALSYGKATGLAFDPIEKKPLYHFYPNSSILSLGPNGCNFSCEFCQNWHISQVDSSTTAVTPEKIVELCLQHQAIGIAYTYSEPLIWYEFVIETARQARAKGLQNVLVTNGYINPEPLQNLLPVIDALNIDIKSMDDEFYKKYCGSRLEPVLETVRIAHHSCHLEITNLIIPTLNDSAAHFEQLATWLAELSPDIPIHFSRYFPHFNLKLPPTPTGTLHQAREIAARHLHYVFLGNIMDQSASSSYCPSCQALLIIRDGYRTSKQNVANGKCSQCGQAVKIIGT